jgi:hypothetical protein
MLMMRRKREHGQKGEANPFHDDLLACNFITSPIDGVILDFLNRGDLNDSELEAAVAELRKDQRRGEYNDTIETVMNEIRSRLGALNQKELDAAKRVASDYLAAAQPGETSYRAEVLQHSGVPCDLAELEQKWATIAPITSDIIIDAAVARLTDEVAKKILLERISQHATAADPKTFEDMLSTGQLSQTFVVKAEARNTSWLKERLRSANNPQLIRNLDRIFVELEKSPEGAASLESFRSALFRALQEISNENALDEFRLSNLTNRHLNWLKSRDQSNPRQGQPASESTEGKEETPPSGELCESSFAGNE